MKKSISILLVLILVLGLAAGCSKEEKDDDTGSSAAGKYTLISINYKGHYFYSDSELDSVIEGDAYIRLKDDGTGYVQVVAVNGSLVGEIKWEGNQMWLKDAEDLPYVFTLEDGKLTATFDGSTYVFEK